MWNILSDVQKYCENHFVRFELFTNLIMRGTRQDMMYNYRSEITGTRNKSFSQEVVLSSLQCFEIGVESCAWAHKPRYILVFVFTWFAHAQYDFLFLCANFNGL